MSEKLTILCPITSRGCSLDRAQQPIFHALIPSMDALDLWGSVRLVVGYDSDDPIWSIDKIRHDVARMEWVPVPKLAGGLTGIWNYLERCLGDWKYLLPANDDLAFETSPLPAIEALKARSNFGLVGFHDHAFPDLATFFVVHRTHREIFESLYPLPWSGAHQDSWIADVYRPWGASEIDQRFQVHNRTGHVESPVTGPRFEYGDAPNYRAVVMEGRRKVNDYLKSHQWIAEPLMDMQLEGARTIIE